MAFTTILADDNLTAAVAMANWNYLKTTLESHPVSYLNDITASAAELNKMDGVTATTAQLNFVSGVTAGAGAASKAVVLDGSKDFSGVRNFTITGSFIIGSASMNETDLEKLDGITNGTQAAGKCVVANADTNIGIVKCTELHIGATSSEVQMLATPTEIDQALDGISANVTDTNLNTLTAGVASDAKALHDHGWSECTSGWDTANINTTYTVAHGLTLTTPTHPLEILIFWRADNADAAISPVSFATDGGVGCKTEYDSTNVYFRGASTFGVNITDGNMGNGECLVLARKPITY